MSQRQRNKRRQRPTPQARSPYPPPAPAVEVTAAAAAVATEFCVDCQRDAAPGDESHAHHQRVTKRTMRSDESGAESVEVRSITDSGTIGRLPTGTPGLDQVLNGGIPKHGVVLIDGPPGIGKSTLFLKTAGHLARTGKNALYVSGEETNGQVAALAHRLGAAHDGLRVFHCDHFERIERELRVLDREGFHVDVLFCDSVQTIRTDTAGGSAGDVGQVRKVGEMLRVLAKSEDGPAVVMTCHVTKDGEMAGPRTLEHACDVRLTFGRGDRQERYLWSVKNRFGPTGVLAQMRMVQDGLVDAPDPSFVLWTELLSDPGVAGFVAAHTAQPVIVPVECAISEPEDGGGTRVVSASGFAQDRLRFLLDARQQHCGIAWGKRTIRVRVPEVGGAPVNDPAIDLAVVAALWSAYTRRRLSPLFFWGEVGLSGRVTAGDRAEQRLRHAASVRGPLQGVLVGDRSGLTSGALRVNAVRHLSDVVAALERLSTPPG